MSFKYERLPIFCYWCGLLCHDDRDCELWLKSRGTLSLDTQQYGSWLRGEVNRFSRRKEDSYRVPPRESFTLALEVDTKPETQTESTNKASTGFTPFSKLETSKLTFSYHLREIDHALGLEPGELLDTLELPNEDVSFQNSIGGVGKMDSDMAVPTSTFLFRPNSTGPRLDPTFVVPAKSKKPSGGTWKRLTRGPLAFKDHDPYPQQLK